MCARRSDLIHHRTQRITFQKDVIGIRQKLKSIVRSYHSEIFENIYQYLKHRNPNLNIVTITTVSQSKVSKLEEENKGTAGYTICVDKDMTKTR